MAGRPTVMTKEKIEKLEEAFIRGLTDTEACLYSDIAPSTLYEYCEKNPGFSERKEQLKQNIRMRAKLNIAKEINAGDKLLSTWYLERKAKDEFSQRTELTGSEGKDLFLPSEEEKKLANEALKSLNDTRGKEATS